MKRRRWNKFRAWLTGYFWLPCPSCGKHFGGHETTSPFDGIEVGEGTTRVVCPDCAQRMQAARGERVRQGPVFYEGA